MIRAPVVVICASRGRPDQAKALTDSLDETTGGRVPVLFYVDDDDQSVYQVPHIRGPRVYSAGAFEALARAVDASFRVWVGDDVRFETPGWDAMLHLRVNAADPWLVGFDDGHGDPTRVPHGATTDGWYRRTGRLFREGLVHYAVDTHIFRVARDLRRFVWMPEVMLRHRRAEQGSDPTSADFLPLKEADKFKYKTLDWEAELARYRQMLDTPGSPIRPR